MGKRRKIKVLVLMGGPSAEHEVSLSTAKNVIAALDSKKYIVKPALITKKGQWLLGPSFTNPLLYNQPAKKYSSGLVTVAPHTRLEESSGRPDVAFIAMHGAYGEDGRVQALLDLAGIPYTGSEVLASALGMDKPYSLQLFRQNGLLIPDYTVVAKKEIPQRLPPKGFVFPLVVKPANHGSSIGISIAPDLKNLKRGISEAAQYSDRIIIQKFIKGRELTCGVLEDTKGKLLAVPPTEIIPKAGRFYDYKSKYADGGSEHLTPPLNLSGRMIKIIQNAACRAHQVIGCSGMSRSDFILGDDGKLYILEINTIPGMTQTSLLPEAAKAAGISFPKLLDLLIAGALKKR